jgi:hypothetical protein
VSAPNRSCSSAVAKSARFLREQRCGVDFGNSGGPMIARRLLINLFLAAALSVAVPSFAQRPARAPKGATAQCGDGSYSHAQTERGACSQHGGVKAWWGPVVSAPAPPSAGRKGAPATASVPKGASGQCVDGTYTRAKSQQGACSQHRGVKTWYADAAPVAPAPRPAPRSIPPAPPVAPAPRPAPEARRVPASPVNGPQGATAKCRDGTYSFAKHHTGACSYHRGVAEWFR